MGIFKKNHETTQENQVSQSNNWDSVSDISFGNEQEAKKGEEISNAERQQKKILAAFATDPSHYGEIIRTKNVEISDDVLNYSMTRLSNGEVPYDEKAGFLKRIKAPISDEGNFDSVLDSLSSKHEQRILAVFGSAGFNNFGLINTDDIGVFKNHYPTPLNFDAASSRFLDQIERDNGKQKRQEYESAMESFKWKVYGKRYEYYKQMCELDKIAGTPKDSTERLKHDMRMLGVRYENERNFEWVPGDTGVYQTSKAQAPRITPESVWTGELRADSYCQDAYFGDPTKQLFGVFDGVGGENGGRIAAVTASRTIGEINSRFDLKSPEDLAKALNQASVNISHLESGKSTGILARVVKHEGRPSLIYATAGDSRLYVVNKRGEARLLTIDEGVGNRITNCLGHSSDCVKQFGEVALQEGDKVVLCSDGITGDFAPDLMSEGRLGYIVHHSRNASEAAKNLTIEASKKDDRTAIVFAPDFNNL